MKRAIIQKSSVKLPQRARADENEDNGRQEKGIAECPECRNVHFKKRWHASLAELQHHTKNKRLMITKEALCPACLMIKEGLFEGELTIDKFPAHLHEELFNLIFNFGERAKAKDPQDRVISAEKERRSFRVTTTENQLATKLGKKIKSVFNTVELNVSHSKEPHAVARVSAVYIRT